MSDKKILAEFKEFAIKGSVVDLAIGIIIGSSFNKVVNSLVYDVIMPPVGAIIKKVDFSNLYISLNGAKYSNLSAAQQAGAPTVNYGLFLNNIITFLITAATVFLIVRWVNRLRRNNESEKHELESNEKTCPYCKKKIDKDARKCPYCTSALIEEADSPLHAQ